MHFENLDFGDASTLFMYFWKYDFCDIYVEACKPILTTEKGNKHPNYEETLFTLYTCLDIGMRILHPMMPFLTEELF
jgi:valyl-tRNA synthetase